jgi:hypothetical protein
MNTGNWRIYELFFGFMFLLVLLWLIYISFDVKEVLNKNKEIVRLLSEQSVCSFTPR